MEIPITVEPIADHGFRATSGGLWGLEIQAPTRGEAVQRLHELIERRFAGMFKDDPLLQPWKDAMAEYRRQTEEGPERP